MGCGGRRHVTFDRSVASAHGSFMFLIASEAQGEADGGMVRHRLSSTENTSIAPALGLDCFCVVPRKDINFCLVTGDLAFWRNARPE
jgi:hypothetical protein